MVCVHPATTATCTLRQGEHEEAVPRRHGDVLLPVELEEFRTWKHFLSVDYGGTVPTCWLFWAEGPTRELIIYDEVYTDSEAEPEVWTDANRSPSAIAEVVYDRLREWFDVPMPEAFGITDHIDYAIGDPAGKSDALSYATCSHPIYPGKGVSNADMPKINDRKAGEGRVNTLLSPSFTCCADEKGNLHHQFGEWAECGICGEKRRGLPRRLSR